MLRKRGKPLLPEEKHLIVHLKAYFDRNKREFGSKETSVQMVSDGLGIGLGTINRVIADYNKDPESINKYPQPKGRPAHSIHASQQEIARSYIRSSNLEGMHITLKMIGEFLQKSSGTEFHLSTLARTLERWGFEFGRGTRTQHLKEKDSVIASRTRYLRKMRYNRKNNSFEKTIRPEVYLDESYVNKNHSNDFIWYSIDDGPWVKKPTGNGERLIIINAITANGWVPNAKTVFKSTRKTGDYHGQMNFDLFKKWFTEKLLPNIPRNSLIVMDNASYHNVLSDNSAPTIMSSKDSMRKWLEKNKVPLKEDCLKAEMIEILKKMDPEPTYALDEIAKSQGHDILRTPPYHPELQPIELCWGVVKNEIARNCDFTMKNLEAQLTYVFDKVSPETCKKIIHKIRKVEDEFWEDEQILEADND